MPADIYVAVGPNGAMDYRKIRVDDDGRLITTHEPGTAPPGTFNVGAVQAIVSVDTITPVKVQVGPSPLSGRGTVIFQALDGDLYWGFSPTLQPFTAQINQLIEVNIGDLLEVWLLSQAGTVDVAISELA